MSIYTISYLDCSLFSKLAISKTLLVNFSRFTMLLAVARLNCVLECLFVVVVVWFGDPCESPGTLLLKAAPGYVVFTA